LLVLWAGAGDRPAFYALVQLLSPIPLLCISDSEHSPLCSNHRAIRPPRSLPRRHLLVVAASTALPPRHGPSTEPASLHDGRRGEEIHVPPPYQRVAHAADASATSALSSSSAMTSIHPPKQQGDVALKTHVANVCFKCFRYMLQMFSHGCCKSRSGCCTCCNGYTCMLQELFKMFNLFQIYVASIFIWMLHIASVGFRCFI